MTDDLDTLRPEVRGLGPCRLCGATGYSMSFGGPDICPACDCGANPDVTRLKRELVEARAELLRLAEYEQAAGQLEIEKAEFRQRNERAEAELAEARKNETVALGLWNAAEGRATKAEGELAAIKAEMDQLRADAETGKAWRTDSSLEEWFPMTAAELRHVKGELDALKARIAGSPLVPLTKVALGNGYSLTVSASMSVNDVDELCGKRVRLVVDEPAERGEG